MGLRFTVSCGLFEVGSALVVVGGGLGWDLGFAQGWADGPLNKYKNTSEDTNKVLVMLGPAAEVLLVEKPKATKATRT